MKYIYTLVAFLMLGIVFFPLSKADAAVSSSSATLFKIDAKGINPLSILDTGITRFTFEATDTANLQNIAYWNIETSCKDDVGIQINDLNENACGKTVQVVTPVPLFEAYLVNPAKKIADFSFIFKAYDAQGSELHEEKQSFLWK